jgi:pimeloyl-ACP methyl ester carboxylesterase
MRRAGRIALIALAVIVGLLVLNALALSNQTKDAEVNVDGAEIVETSIGGLQVLDEGDPRGAPVVLIHGYTASMRWFDELAAELADGHRVVRVDLLGHGGSDKPKAGYAIEEQARGIAEALAELGVDNATIVGHSLGATVATELGLQSRELAARIVNLDQAPDNGYGELEFTARLGYVPIIGEAINRLAQIGPAGAVKDEYQQAFAPDFAISSGFDDPDQVVEDLREMTYTSYSDAAEAENDYTDSEPLDERLADAGIPLLVIFGAQEQIYDEWEQAIEAYKQSVPGARVAVIEVAGHSPNVETPEQVASLIREFIADPGDEAAAEHPPRDVGKKPGAGGNKPAGSGKQKQG